MQEIEAANEQELAYKKENVQLFSQEIQTRKAAIAKAQEMFRMQSYVARTQEREAAATNIEAANAEELDQKQKFTAIFRDETAIVKQANAERLAQIATENYNQRVAQRQDHIHIIEEANVEEQQRKDIYVQTFRAEVERLVEARIRAAREESIAAYQRRITERNNAVANIEAEANQELAHKQQYVEQFREDIRKLVNMRLAEAERVRIEKYKVRVAQKIRNLQEIERDNAEELMLKQQNVSLFQSLVTQQSEQRQKAAEEMRILAFQLRVAEKEAAMAAIENARREELTEKQEKVRAFQLMVEEAVNQRLQDAAEFRIKIQMARSEERAVAQQSIQRANAMELVEKQFAAKELKVKSSQMKVLNEALRMEEIEERREEFESYKQQMKIAALQNDAQYEARVQEAKFKSLPASFLKAFNSMDANNDGVVDFVEFQKALGRLGLDWDDQTRYQVFRTVDVDNSGTLDVEEFAKVIGQVESIMENAGDEADSNEILRQVFDNLQKGEEFAEEQKDEEGGGFAG